jgi:hypothetical protein
MTDTQPSYNPKPDDMLTESFGELIRNLGRVCGKVYDKRVGDADPEDYSKLKESYYTLQKVIGLSDLPELSDNPRQLIDGVSAVLDDLRRKGFYKVGKKEAPMFVYAR